MRVDRCGSGIGRIQDSTTTNTEHITNYVTTKQNSTEKNINAPTK